MANNPSLITRDTDKIAAATGNLYESVSVISKRARQISTKMKEELSNKLSEFASAVDNLEEVFENREQIEISKYYERLPKPTTVATDEFLESKLQWRYVDEDSTNSL
ncbi:DNA-directed RNA polymerase subunit omega [Larkinella soli]|uniref:DNA-directed RNA polymerase subunit omega n=1 Tax=Larkinella soli TaxID=1770527 RepID=UPI000FFBB655|nr:DNA-directed RNA polymerase subunit omega [Larkinella soli]